MVDNFEKQTSTNGQKQREHGGKCSFSGRPLWEATPLWDGCIDTFERSRTSKVSGSCQKVSGSYQTVSGSCQKVSGSCQKVSGSWRRLARRYATSSSPERRSTYAHARRTGVTSGDLRWPINFDPVPECRD